MIKNILLMLIFFATPSLANKFLISEVRLNTKIFPSKKFHGQVSQSGEFIKKHHNALFNDAKSPYFGAKKKSADIIFFSDYNCIFCKNIEVHLVELKINHPELKVVVKLVAFHGQSSMIAAQFALSVWEKHPELFFKFHQLLMAEKGEINNQSIVSALKKIGINDITEPYPDTFNIVQSNMQLADKLKIDSTPTLLTVNDYIIHGFLNFSQLEDIIQSLPLEKK